MSNSNDEELKMHDQGAGESNDRKAFRGKCALMYTPCPQQHGQNLSCAECVLGFLSKKISGSWSRIGRYL